MLIATTNIAGVTIFALVRVKRIRMWTAGSTQGVVTTATCQFAGLVAGVVGDLDLHIVNSISAFPGNLDCRPSSKSLASDWQPYLADTAFILNCPTATIVDVQLEFRSNFGSVQGVQNALVGATGGTMYFRGLDGLATAGTAFVPVVPAGDSQ